MSKRAEKIFPRVVGPALILGLGYCFFVEPDWGRLVFESSRLTGLPEFSYVSLTAPGGTSVTLRINARTPEELEDFESRARTAAEFVSERFSERWPEAGSDCIGSSYLSLHLIPDEVLQDREILIFQSRFPDDGDVFGVTAFTHVNKAWSFICSDCSESIDDILVHELTHFFLSVCGIPSAQQDESMCHEMVEDFQTSRS